MKTTTGLALAAAIAAAVAAVYTGLPAAAVQPPPVDRPALPPIVLDPGVKLPTPTPAEAPKPPPAPVKAEPPLAPKFELPQIPAFQEHPFPPPPREKMLPPLPAVPPAPLPVPQPIVPAAKADPTKLPAVPPPPVAAQPQPLPTVPPPAAPKLPVVPPPALTPPPVSPPLPVVPPPAITPPPVSPALPVVPPPTDPAPKATPLSAPRTEQAQPLPPPLPVTTPAAPSIGNVVVLQDGKLLEGHVSRSGEKVVVRRGVIDQPFPNEQVKYITPDKDAAYRAVLTDTKADDAAARLRLARWCMYNGMRANALTEAREVVRLEPTNRVATELARTLEESLRLYPEGGAPRPVPTAAPAPGLPAVPPPPTAVEPVAPEPTIAPEAVVAFGPRVQPVLLNKCGGCHAHPTHASRFKLVPVPANEVNPAATQQNLRATAAQVKKTEPAASPLLAKALAAHGGMPVPAFADRDEAAYRVLQAWVYLSVGELAPPVAAAPPAATPALPLPPPSAPATDVRPVLPPPPLPGPDVRPSLPPAPAPPPIPPAEGNAPEVPVIPPATAGRPASAPVVPAGGFGQSAPPPVQTGPARDEFDPANFNRPPARR